MKKRIVASILFGAALLGASCSSCLAFTMDDLAQAKLLIGKTETYDEGMALVSGIFWDDVFVAEHPAEVAWVYTMQARQLRNKKQITNAAVKMKKALAVAPKGSGIAGLVMSELASLQMELPDKAAAAVLYQRLITEYPKGDVAGWKLAMSKSYYYTRRYDASIVICAEVIRDCPANGRVSEAMTRTAACYHKQGKYQMEAATLRQIISQFPDTRAANNAAVVVDALSVLHLGSADRNSIVQDHKDQAAQSLCTYAKGGIEYFAPTEDEETAAAYQAGLDMSPTDNNILAEIEFQYGAWCRSRKRHQQAVDLGQRLLADCKGLDDEKNLEFNALMLIGYGYQCMGQYDKAIPALRDVVERLKSEHPGGIHNLATCYRLSGNTVMADALFDRLIANGPQTGMAQQAFLEKALMRLGNANKTEEGISLFRQIFAIEVDDPSGDKSFEFMTALQTARPSVAAVDTLLSGSESMPLEDRKRMLASIGGALRVKMGKPKQARDVYATLASILEGDAKSEVVFQMADCDYSAGEWATGVSDCRDLYQMGREGKFAARSKVLEASCLIQSGDYAGAKKAFQEVLAAFPDSVDAEVATQYIAVLSAGEQGGVR